MACVTLALLVALRVTAVLACNGYELVVNKLTTCNSTNQTSSVTLHNFTVSLSEDCRLMSSGCVSYIAYNNMTVSYLVKKRNDLMPPYIFKKLILGCMERGKISQEILDNMAPLKSLTTCPVTADKICSGRNTFVDVSRYQSSIHRAEGRIAGQVDIAFNSGSSCFKFDVTMQKRRNRTTGITDQGEGSDMNSGSRPPAGQDNNVRPPAGQNNNARPPAGQNNNARPPAGQNNNARPPAGQGPQQEGGDDEANEGEN